MVRDLNKLLYSDNPKFGFNFKELSCYRQEDPPRNISRLSLVPLLPGGPGDPSNPGLPGEPPSPLIPETK